MMIYEKQLAILSGFLFFFIIIFYCEADDNIYGNFFTHQPALDVDLIISMVSGAAIPSSELNHSFNILNNFLLVEV